LKKEVKLFEWLKEECKDWRTILIFFIVCVIMYIPTWGGYLVYFIFKPKVALTVASVYAAFWLGPFTPFIGIAIAITLVIKKIMKIGVDKDEEE
jgi:hypothetical protein